MCFKIPELTKAQSANCFQHCFGFVVCICEGVLLYTFKVQASREMNRLNHMETIKIKEDAELKRFFWLPFVHFITYFSFYFSYKHVHIALYTFSKRINVGSENNHVNHNHDNHLHACFESMSQVVRIMLELNRVIWMHSLESKWAKEQKWMENVCWFWSEVPARISTNLTMQVICYEWAIHFCVILAMRLLALKRWFESSTKNHFHSMPLHWNWMNSKMRNFKNSMKTSFL